MTKFITATKRRTRLPRRSAPAVLLSFCIDIVVSRYAYIQISIYIYIESPFAVRYSERNLPLRWLKRALRDRKTQRSARIVLSRGFVRSQGDLAERRISQEFEQFLLRDTGGSVAAGQDGPRFQLAPGVAVVKVGPSSSCFSLRLPGSSPFFFFSIASLFLRLLDRQTRNNTLHGCQGPRGPKTSKRKQRAHRS